MTNSSVFLTWDDDPEPLSQYEISLTGVSTPNPVTAAFFATQTFTRQDSTLQIGGLLSGTTYQFSVRALGEAGPSPSVSVFNTTLEGCELLLHMQTVFMIILYSMLYLSYDNMYITECIHVAFHLG